jgi:hypothetical protein
MDAVEQRANRGTEAEADRKASSGGHRLEYRWPPFG